MTPREQIAALIDELAGPEVGKRRRTSLATGIEKGLGIALHREGFTSAMIGDALGVPAGTVRGWRKDPEFAASMDDSTAERRGWLLGMMRLHIEHDDGKGGRGGRAATAAMNHLAHMWIPETRKHAVEVTHKGAPTPGEARTAVLSIVNRGRPHDEDAEG